MTIDLQTPRDAKSSGDEAILSVNGSNDWNWTWSAWLHASPGDITVQSDSGSTEDQAVALLSDYSYVKGWDNPNFNARKLAGELLPVTPWIKERRRDYLSGTFLLDYISNEYPGGPAHPGGSHWDGHFRASSSDPFIPDVYLSAHSGLIDSFSDERESFAGTSTDLVVQRAAARIYSQGFDALTSSAEFHKTVRLFIGLKKRIIKYITTGRLLDMYLEGRYGWRILIFEIIDLHKAFTAFDKTRTRYTEIAFDRDNISYTKDLGGATYRCGPVNSQLWSHVIGYALNASVKGNITLKGTVTADFFPSQFRANLVDTGWELVPFSFVVDWFIGIGTWIQAMSFDSLATDYVAAGGLRMQITKEPKVWNQYIDGNNYPFFRDVANEGGFIANGVMELDLIDRTPTTISNVPQTNINLNAFKVLDLIALLNGIERSLPKGARL